MKKFTFYKSNWFPHVAIWLILTLYFLILDPVSGPLMANIVGTSSLMLNYVFVYYSLGLYVYPTYWPAKRIRFIGFLLLVYVLFVGIDVVIFAKLIPFLGGVNPLDVPRIIQMDLMWFTIISIASLTNHYNQIVVKKLRLQNEKEKLLDLKELNYLKSQFNSHVTMNFLNFCYGNVYKDLPETGDAIVLFSDILRYTLKTKPDELIPLTEEVEYLNNYLQLQKLLTAEVYVDFELSGDISNHKILPRLLITLLENSFKHGLYNQKDKPISIVLQACADRISFSVKNHKTNRADRHETGIGQTNLKKVLALFYDNRYRLDIQDTPATYSSSLILTSSSL